MEVKTIVGVISVDDSKLKENLQNCVNACDCVENGHDWEPLNDGTFDVMCNHCKKKAMRASLSQPIPSDMVQPILRETMNVITINGKFTMYKDKFEEELQKQLGLPSSLLGGYHE